METSRRNDMDRLVREHGPFMRRLACALTRNTAEADDLVGDTWFEALKHGAAAMKNERAWLRAVMRRRASRLRYSPTQATQLEDGADAELDAGQGAVPSEVAQRIEAERLLSAALDTLREPYRTAIYLRYLEEWKPGRISSELGVPLKTVKTRLHRGLHMLRQELEELQDDPAGRDGGAGDSRWMAVLAPLAVSSPGLRGGAVALPGPTTLIATVQMKKLMLAATLLMVVGLGWRMTRPAGSSADPQLVVGADDGGEPLSAEVAVSSELALPLDRSSKTTEVALAPRAAEEVPLALEVAVLDHEGRPAEDGHVILSRESGGGLRSSQRVLRLGSDGVARFDDLRAGVVTVQESRTHVRRRVTLSGDEQGKTTLQRRRDPASRVTGQVVDPGGAPVPGATIWAKRLGPLLPIATANGEGKFEVYTHANSSLQASVPDRLPSYAASVSSLNGDVDQGRRVTLTLGERGAVLRGRVLDTAGRPVEGALVRAGSLERRVINDTVFRTSEPVSVLSDEDGEFTYGQALPEGSWYVGAEAPDGRAAVASHAITLPASWVELTVEVGSVIHGQVLGVDGLPAATAEVTILPMESQSGRRTGILGVQHRTWTSEDGRYELQGVIGDELEISVESAREEARAVQRVRVQVIAPGERRRVDLQLDDHPVLAGMVVDKDGLPVPDVLIRAKQRYGAYFSRRVTTDAAGQFRLTAVDTRPGGRDTWAVKAVSDGQSGSRELGLLEGVKLGTEDIRIVAERPALADAFVEGRVVFEGNLLPANLEVVIYPVYAEPRRTFSGQYVSVDAKTGSFRHGPVARGKYRIVARQTDAQLGSVEGLVLEAGETLIAPDLVLSQADAGR